MQRRQVVLRFKKTQSNVERAVNVADDGQNLPDGRDATEVAESTGAHRMEQGDQTSGVTRSQSEHAVSADEGGLAWVGMQWRMEGYCGRVENASPQLECCDQSGALNAEAGAIPSATDDRSTGTEPLGPIGSTNRRYRPARRGPDQQVA